MGFIRQSRPFVKAGFPVCKCGKLREVGEPFCKKCKKAVTSAKVEITVICLRCNKKRKIKPDVLKYNEYPLCKKCGKAMELLKNE